MENGRVIQNSVKKTTIVPINITITSLAKKYKYGHEGIRGEEPVEYGPLKHHHLILIIEP